jgi:hypothetical protein
LENHNIDANRSRALYGKPLKTGQILFLKFKSLSLNFHGSQTFDARSSPFIVVLPILQVHHFLLFFLKKSLMLQKL